MAMGRGETWIDREVSMKPWMLYASLTLLAWGVWGFFSKLASSHARPRQTLLFQAVGVMAFGFVVLTMERFHIQWSPQGFGWSAAAGFVNFIGFLAFFAAIEKGKVSTIIAMSSLYPVITIVLSVLFLQEKISSREGLGIACALLAGFLLAG
jgi:bacterial/archaeal transporter family protein